jgi:hypothetical protein
MKLKNHFEITGIGSMPHESEKKACDIIFPDFSRIPFWPQLVNKSFLEDMMVQFSERMPGVDVDIERKKIFINRNRNINKEIVELNERCASEDLEYFSVSEDYAAGFYEYLYRLKDRDNTILDYLKGQITGPVSLAFTVSDQDGIPLYFDRELREAACKTLSYRARWQAARLKKIFRDAIIFIDEPSLAFFRHSASNSKIKKEDLSALINSVADAIHTEACYAGIHCCGDADWDFVLSTNIDIIGIDAYNYGGEFVKSCEKIYSFLDRDGIIAWGIVPTASDVLKEDVETLSLKLESYIDSLCEKNIDRQKIINSSLITPSCGCGTLSAEDAEGVVKRCAEVSQLAKERIQ